MTRTFIVVANVDSDARLGGIEVQLWAAAANDRDEAERLVRTEAPEASTIEVKDPLPEAEERRLALTSGQVKRYDPSRPA